MGKRKFPAILRTVFLIVISLVLGVNVYSWNARSLTGNVLPMPFGYGGAVVLSGSMEPALSVGDLLIVREQERYAVGDIVVYQSGRTPVVHRIVAIDDESVTTRGDANNANDETFVPGAIKGAVIAAIPLVGYAVWALKSPVAVVVLLAAAVLLTEGSFRAGKAEKEAQNEKLKAEIRALMEELKED